ncbi:MAG: lipolytic protein family [Bacteroidota bacterium]|jgi:lysophospholipase L1-like esterase|nr:lipolytic protein family [Bacteroidota bacterium]
MKYLFLLLFGAMLSNYSFTQEKTIRYVALGDSYTIGTGTTQENAWPTVLTKHLQERNIKIELVANPAHNGWTTTDVIERELPVLDKSNPDFVTLLIGVNDWVQGMKPETFEKNLEHIIEHVQSKLSDKNNFLLITIPDFGVTENGKIFSNGRNISEGIAWFNIIVERQAKKHGLKTADLYTISKKMGTDKTLVSDDGLHPSAKGYKVWEEQIFKVAEEMLK